MIYGERIRFRAVERDDLPRFVAWLNDPEVLQGLLMNLPLSAEVETSWYEEMLKRPADEHPLVIEVQEAGGWLPIGNCSYFKIDWHSRAGEVGIFIGEKRLWNQGYGTDAMRLLLRHGFAALNLNRVALDVFATNLRAVRCYEKVGFKHEGCKRQAIYQDGQYIDVLQMSVLREEWESQ